MKKVKSKGLVPSFMNILFKGFKIESLIITILIMLLFILIFLQIKDVNEDTDYLFFLSTPEGKTIFSKNLDEHNLAKQKYLK